ncbi:MAG: hypothetical protein A2511_06785 [Deltaproteobacteria bacterium RIFOXYD12_FULL_50_9]|nr:MAG: hypothetical protein A2511_06785 [Deltaproteobacteria bacterium RIFOXYD12_FULL_50_9]
MLFPALVFAGETLVSPVGWDLEADSLTSYSKSADVEAAGDVVLRRPAGSGVKPIEIKADWLRYNQAKNLVEGRGHLSFSSTDETIFASAARFDLNRQTGILNDTTMFLQESHLYFSGSLLEKNGDVSYRFIDGKVTACPVRPGHSVPWALWSSRAEVTVDEFAVLRHATFRIKDFPVFYTPYIIFPVKTIRESGLLFPEISRSSRDGVGLIAPYFVNISPSVDLTMYLGYLERKGANLATEFRYMLDADDRGTIMANYLQDGSTDNVLDDFKQDGYYRTLHDRYWLRGKADHEFAGHVIGRLDLDLVSDRDYLREYRDGVIGFTRSDRNFVETFNRGLQEESIPFRESSLQLSRAVDSLFWGGELRWVDDTAEDTATFKQIHTLPRLMANFQEMLWDSPVNLDWHSEYVNYWREEGVGYQRLDLQPGLRLSLPAGQLLEGRLRGGVRETLYRVETQAGGAAATGNQGYKNRRVYDFETNAAFVLARNFDLEAGSWQWLNHTVRPNLSYNYAGTERDDDLPVLDSEDLVLSANTLTYGVNNFFKLGGRQANSEYEHYLGYFKMFQTLDITEERRVLVGSSDKRRPFSDINFDTLVQPIVPLSIRYQTALNVYGAGVGRYTLETRYAHANGNILSLDYSYYKGGARDLRIWLQYRLFEQLVLKVDTTRSLLLDRTANESVGLIYTPDCWSVEVDYSQNSDDQRIMVIFSLAGFGKALEFGKDNF